MQKRHKVLRETNKQSNKEKGNKQTNTTTQLKTTVLFQARLTELATFHALGGRDKFTTTLRKTLW